MFKRGLPPFEILVMMTTNVGWTPLFPRVAAIVTDIGAGADGGKGTVEILECQDG